MAEIFAWDEGRVLKLFRGNFPEESHRESSIARMAYAQGAHTPQTFEIVEVDGRPGIIYERVEGISLLKALATRPWQVIVLGRGFADLQHTVHRCKIMELPSAHAGLAMAIPKVDNLSLDARQALLKILKGLPDEDWLCHGDFHPENVILSPKGPVILDWPNAARGCPLADVARTVVMLRFGAPVEATPKMMLLAIDILRRQFISAYLHRYFQQSPYSQRLLPQWEVLLAAHRLLENIPGESEGLMKFVTSRLKEWS
jgi:tRNA A-37 threonylcarbamoyl transferase component Bud32